MPIKVLINHIKKEDILAILDYYNTTKQSGEPNLGVLPCKEGGFKLDIDINTFIQKYKKYGGNIPPIKQIRFHNNILVSYYNFPGFSDSEEWRLYLAIVYSIGRENVKWYNSYSGAIISSPNIKRSPSSGMILRSRSTNSLDDIWHVPRVRL